MTGLIPCDVGPALLAALRANAARAMFPLSNVLNHGTAGDRRSTVFHCDDPTAPRAVLATSEEGMLMPLLLDGAAFPDLRPILAGRVPMGAVGETSAVRAALAASGLADAPTTLASDEPHFEMDLARLRVPPGPGHLVPATHDPVTVLNWRIAYKTELRSPPTDRETLSPQIEEAIARDTIRLLIDDYGRPLAMTGINAQAGGVVQVGGVYVPPALRRRGLGRRVVVLHLAEMRARGIKRATLFAANEAAARAYAGIGFARIGTFSIVLFAREAVA